MTNIVYADDDIGNPGNRMTWFQDCAFVNATNGIHFAASNVDGLLCRDCRFRSNDVGVRFDGSTPLNQLVDCDIDWTNTIGIKLVGGAVRCNGCLIGASTPIEAGDAEGRSTIQGFGIDIHDCHVEWQEANPAIKLGSGGSGYVWNHVSITNSFFNLAGVADADQPDYWIEADYIADNDFQDGRNHLTIDNNQFRRGDPQQAYVCVRRAGSVSARGHTIASSNAVPLVDIPYPSDLHSRDIVEQKDVDVVGFSGDGTTTTFTDTHNLIRNPPTRENILVTATVRTTAAKNAGIRSIWPVDDDGDGNYEAIEVEFIDPPADGSTATIAYEATLVK